MFCGQKVDVHSLIFLCSPGLRVQEELLEMNWNLLARRRRDPEVQSLGATYQPGQDPSPTPYMESLLKEMQQIRTNGHCFKHMQSIFNSSPPVPGLLCCSSLHCLPSSGRYPVIIHYSTLSLPLPTVTTTLSLRNPLLQHSTGLW